MMVWGWTDVFLWIRYSFSSFGVFLWVLFSSYKSSKSRGSRISQLSHPSLLWTVPPIPALDYLVQIQHHLTPGSTWGATAAQFSSPLELVQLWLVSLPKETRPVAIKERQDSHLAPVIDCLNSCRKLVADITWHSQWMTNQVISNILDVGAEVIIASPVSLCWRHGHITGCSLMSINVRCSFISNPYNFL